MLKGQQTLVVSKYMELYDILIPKEDMLRQIKDLVDFSFIYEELAPYYSEAMGRTAEDPVRMFKFLMLKSIFKASDKYIVKRTRTDLAFKYFLDLAPEETEIIHSTTLTKFRRLRLKDETLLNKLIKKTLEIAKAHGIDVGNTLIVDATHTHSRYNKRTAQDLLLVQAKKIRKEVYQIDETLKSKMPPKVTSTELNEVMAYCDRLAQVIEDEPLLCLRDHIREGVDFLREGVEDIQSALIAHADAQAKVGYKSKEDAFFGYKNHLTLSTNRLITSALVTSGEEADGPLLVSLIEKAKENGVEVKAVIGDTAYSGKQNLMYAKEQGIELIAKLHPVISNGFREDSNGFTFNKDADLYVCPAGHLAQKKLMKRRKKADQNQTLTYYFDVKKCQDCPLRQGCYKEGAKTKTYNVTIKSDYHLEQEAFQETDHFKELNKQRYMIEAKNSELKNQHGLDVALTSGLLGMTIQTAMTAFTVNIKRILNLKKE